MQLPVELREGIAELVSEADSRSLARAAAEISERYRAAEFAQAVLRNDVERVAYVAVRMPGTYGACAHTFREVKRVIGEERVESLLDLGAGPGTAAWAALQYFPEIARVTLVERDGGLIDIGKRLAKWNGAIAGAKWVPADVESYHPEQHDLVVISYVLGELGENARERLLRRAWHAAKKLLVMIEPGTMRGFQSVLAARKSLLGEGGRLVAPCPHEEACPMAATGDWCHFSQRVERTAEHRRLKQGELGYEDEKFSYVSAAKFEVKRPASRVLRHPVVRPGHIQLVLCRPNGTERVTVTKSNKPMFRQARRAEWGSAWEE